jgi:predicted DNA-binding transcriptional regulator YafY
MEFIVNKIEEQLGTTISDSLFSKDIQQMKRMYSAPIKFDRAHNGYCYTEEGFSIKEFPLTHEEIEALDYSTALLHHLKGTRMFQQFENAINKVIEGYRVSKILGKSEQQILQVEEPLGSEGHQFLEQILKAIVERSVLCVTYRGFGKEEKIHQLSPYLLKEYRNRWYVIGFSDRTENTIVLALDRIREIKSGTHKFNSKTDFNPEDYFKYSVGITQVNDTNAEKVRLQFTAFQAHYIISQPLHHSQKIISETDQGVVIELEVYITTELKMAILSYGKEVKVLAPGSLQKEIKATLDDMYSLYKDI